MRVKTLNLKEFQETSHKLAYAVKEDYGYWKVVVAIANGGIWVAKAFEGEGVQTVIVDNHRRKSTQWKRCFADKIISVLPTWVCNLLRMAESKITEKRYKDIASDGYHLPVDIQEKLSEINSKMREEKAPLVVVVDDAADTGFTLQNVCREVSDAMPDCKVISAVITATLPFASEDVSLWRNRTLIRFPWAPDAKKSVRKDFEEWKKRITEDV